MKNSEGVAKNSRGVMKNSGDKQGVIFVIERAFLELVKITKKDYYWGPKEQNYELLNGRKANWNRYHYRRSDYNPSDWQPEIAHEAIKAVLGSPLNKSGQLKALYVQTEKDEYNPDKDVLIEIKTHARIPEDYDSFADLMVQLLRRSSITADGTREKVLRIVPGPVTQYLPANSVKIGLSHSLGCEKRVDLQRHIARISSDKPLVFVVGAMAHGTIDVDYVDEYIMTDKHPDNATICIQKICEAVLRK